jgi:hypothetical protein
VLLGREAGDAYAGIDQQIPLQARMLVDVVSSQILHNQAGLPKEPVLLSIEGRWVEAS